jgi:HD-like signal output (HDOD) protein
MSAAVDPTCQAAGQAEAAARIADALIRNRLEPLPAIVIELLDALENGGLAIADLAQRIGRDPRLGARILQVVNSPFYGLPRRIADIGEAVMVLGIDSVRSIVVGASLGNRMHQAASAGFDVHRLLLHSFGSALGAQRLAARAGIAASTAFTACILHDIGKLAMHAFDADGGRAHRAGCRPWRRGRGAGSSLALAAVDRARRRPPSRARSGSTRCAGRPDPCRRPAG